MENWYSLLFGHSENSNFERDRFMYEPNGIWGPELKSKSNGKIFYPGKFSCKNKKELQNDIDRLLGHPDLLKRKNFSFGKNKNRIEHVAMNDVFEEHAQNPGAMFMAASQLNCLEFASPRAVPEDGISIYEFDRTQGPACALACAPGTFFRNYLYTLPLTSTGRPRKFLASVGQSRENQINLLGDTETLLTTKTNEKYWEITNGYLDSTSEQLKRLNEILSQHKKGINIKKEEVKDTIRIGLLENTQVVFSYRTSQPWILVDDVLEEKIFVDQAYCSAIACGYSKHVSRQNIDLWKPFAVLLLEAQYEAVLLAAYRSRLIKIAESFSDDDDDFYRIINKPVFLTILGGGVFGNKPEWIFEAMANALKNTENLGLHIKVCHYQKIDENFVSLLEHFLAV